MKRAHAIHSLASHRVKALSENVARALLLEHGYWNFSDASELRDFLEALAVPPPSEALMQSMLADDVPPPRLDSVARQELLLCDFEWELRRASNRYIEEELAAFGVVASVEGTPSPSGRCPCCAFLSIDEGEDGLWDICPVCNWENGGDAPNHISLAQAQANFREFGAITREALIHVEKDAQRKYERH